MTALAESPTLHALLERLVDYAGLFPPAALSMREAAANYAAYRASPDVWMLGRFVVPIARLDALLVESARWIDGREGPWALSGLAGTDQAADAESLRAFNRAQRGRLVVDTVELRAATAPAIDAALRSFGPDVEVFVEIPLDDDPRPLLEVVKRHGACAKVRTGGTTASAFPGATVLARFLSVCAALELPFKATAGLHHPLRGEQPLTYDDGAPSATMFGFLNVFLAAGFARAGLEEASVVQLLEERDARAFSFGDDAVTWRGDRLTREQIGDARHSFALAFGSCSFREPVDDLHQLALL